MKEVCDVCRQKLSGQIVQDAWGHVSHAAHDQPLYFCGSCQRMMSRHTSRGGFFYEDGRPICGYCRQSAVTEGVAVNKTKRAVLEILEKTGFVDIPKNIEIVLANSHALTNKTNHAGTRGVTLTNTQYSHHKRVGMVHQIGILYGLPYIEFAGILAHELLHVWQNQNDVKLPAMYTEGFCNLGSYAIYAASDESHQMLAKHLIRQLMENKDPIYGNGFRLMYKKLEGMGWPALISDVLANKNGWEASLWKKIFGK